MDEQKPVAAPEEPEPPSPTDVSGPAAPTGLWTRRGRTISLAILLALVVGVGIAAGPTTWHVLREKDTTIDTPPAVAGLTRDDGAGAETTSEYLRTALGAAVSLDKTIGAIYSENGDASRSVLVIGGTGLLLSPEKHLDTLFGMITDETGGVEGVTKKPAGPLGGVLKCGTTKIDAGTMAVCGWADHGSLMAALFPGRSVDESAALLLKMRGVMQHRS